MKLERIEFEAISKEQIATYAEASGDFNKIHLDDQYAKAAGLDSVIAHGMLTMGLASVALEGWELPVDKIRSFETKFKEKVYPGESLYAENIQIEVENDQVRLIRFKICKKASEQEVLQSEASFHVK